MTVLLRDLCALGLAGFVCLVCFTAGWAAGTRERVKQR